MASPTCGSIPSLAPCFACHTASRSCSPPKRLQLTPNSSLQSIRGTALAAGAVPQRWRSALLGAAEPQVLDGEAGVAAKEPDNFVGGLCRAVNRVLYPLEALHAVAVVLLFHKLLERSCEFLTIEVELRQH